MNTEDRLTELLQDTADGYTPHAGLGPIHDKVARRRRARRIRNVAVPIAAAALIAAVAVPLALRGGKQSSQRITNRPPEPTTVVPPEPTTSPVTTPSPKSAAGPPSTVFAGPPGGAVPPGFSAASVTFVSASMGWVLGYAPCPVAPCALAILRTTDGGRTWKSIPAPATFLGGDDPAAVTSIRFANDRDGFAFGNGLWATHDGGAVWHQLSDVVGVSPYSIENLAATPAGVYAVVQDSGHTPHFRLVRADASGDKFSVVHDFGPNAAVVTMAAGGGTVYVTFVPAGSNAEMLARVEGASFVTRALPDQDCERLAPSSAADLIVLCGLTQASGGSFGTRALYGTTNGGDSWTRLPDPGRGAGWDTSGLADAGRGHAVIATNDAGGAGLLVTTDGGQHWSVTLHFEDTAGTGWGDLGFENGSTGVVIFGPGQWPADPGGGTLYRTTDGGVTWSKVSFSA